MQSDNFIIKSNRQIATGIYSMNFTADHSPKAGQFYMLHNEQGKVLLPRPISVCDYIDGELVFLYQVVGTGTKQLAKLKAGESLRITGPLGNGFPTETAQNKIALVGGGIGIAPLLLTARTLKQAGIATDCYCGYRDETYLTTEIAEQVDKLYIATETGQTGHKGYITEILGTDYSVVYCCGPTPMMKAVVAFCGDAKIPCYISMENRMACGIGACLVCTCTDHDGNNLRTCKDGPVFSGEGINFDA